MCVYVCVCFQLVQGLCMKLKQSVQPLTSCNIQEVQGDILAAEEVLHNAKTSITASDRVLCEGSLTSLP